MTVMKYATVLFRGGTAVKWNKKVQYFPLKCSVVEVLSCVKWKYSSKVQVPQNCTYVVLSNTGSLCLLEYYINLIKTTI